MSHLLILLVILMCYCMSQGDDSIRRNVYTKISRDYFSYTKSDDSSVVSCSSPLNCWLDSLYFFLPETCFNYNGVKGCFSRLTCKSVSASQIASGVEAFHSLIIQLYGGEAQCKGKWEYGYIGGEITAHIKRTDVSIVLKSFEADIYPVAVNFTSCDVPNITIDLKFRGGLVGVLLQSISNIIERILENDVKTLICKDFAEYVAINVSGYLVHDVDPYLRKFTHVLPTPVSNNVITSASSHQYINWNKMPFYHANKLFAMLLGDQERQNIIQLLVRQFSTVDNDDNGLFLDLQNSTYTFALTKQGVHSTSTTTTTSTTSSNPLLLQIVNHPKLYSYSQAKDNELGNLTLILHSIRIAGLEGLTSTEQLLLPHPNLNHTLQSSMTFQDINITLLLTVRILPAQSSVHGETLLENTEIFIQLSNITINTIIDLLVYKKNINNLYMDQLQLVDCLLSATNTVNITSLTVESTINKMKVIVFDNNGKVETNNLESNVDELLSNLLTSLAIDYQHLLQQVVHGVISGPVRSHINTILTTKLSPLQNNPSACPPHHIYSNHTKYIVWKKLSFLQSFLDRLVNPTTINRYVLQRTHQSGQIDTSLPNEWTFKASGLNSILNFSLLHPVAAAAIADNSNSSSNDNRYDLASEVAIGKLPSINFPTSHYYNNTAMAMSVSGILRDYPIHVSVLAAYASLQTEWEVKYDVNKLLDLQLHDAHRLSCVLSPLDTLSMRRLQVALRGLRVVLEGIVITEASSILSRFLSYLSSDKFQSLVNTEILSLLAASRVLCAIPANADAVANTTTPAAPPSSSSSSSWTVGPLAVSVDDLLVTAGFALCFVVLGIISIWFPRRKLGEGGEGVTVDEAKGKKSTQSSVSSTPSANHNNDYYPLSPSPAVVRVAHPSNSVDECVSHPTTYSCIAEQQQQLLLQLHHPDPPKEFLANPSSTSTASALLFRSDLPLLLRYGLVLLVLLNISLFLWSNISDAAVVVLHTFVEGSEYHPARPVFTFSLSGTVVDMWRAKVYPLAVLIAFFSGVWPYAKLGMMLLAWLAPESRLTSARREQWLISLDFLGKWSLIDIFVLVLMTVAFHVKLTLASDLKVVVNVVPILGFHLFLAATMLSLLLGHSMLACHRSVSIGQWITGRGLIASTSAARAGKRGGGGWCSSSSSSSSRSIRPTESLCSYQFSIPKRKGIVISLSVMGRTLILLLCFLMAGLLLGAAALASFAFRFGGLVGWWLGEGGASHAYSLLEVAFDLPTASGSPHDSTIRIIQTVFLAFGIGIPFLSLLTITLLWVVPVTLVGQRRLLVVAEILNAWSALDVFAVSVAAAILQVQQFAAFIIGDSCDLINRWMSLLLKTPQGKEGGEGSKCFDVTAVLTPYSWCLFSAAFLFAVVGPLTLRYTRIVLRGRSLRYVSAMSSLSVDEMELEVDDGDCGSTSGDGGGGGPSSQQPLLQQQQLQYKSFFPVHSSHPSVSSSCSTSTGGSEDVDSMVVKLLGAESCQVPIPITATSQTSASSCCWGGLCQDRNSSSSSSSLVGTEVVEIMLWLGLLQQQVASSGVIE